MDDTEVIARINALVDEEHTLDARASTDAARRPPTRLGLQELEVALDQCWDLLRQRRARREFGDDPSTAEVRSEDVVEHYRQ